jgi:hypothetical protein
MAKILEAPEHRDILLWPFLHQSGQKTAGSAILKIKDNLLHLLLEAITK